MSDFVNLRLLEKSLAESNSILEPTIASCREIQTSNEGTVIFATVFGDVPLLVFWRIPPMFRKFIERKIELIFEHEQLHFILAREKLDTKGLDKIFPYVEDLEKWRWHKFESYGA